MRLIDRLLAVPETERSMDQIVEWVNVAGDGVFPSYSRAAEEMLEHSFDGYVAAGMKGNPIVFACVSARLMLFSEARFAWRDVSNGNIFGDQNLTPLEQPTPSRTTQELLALCELDATFAGNSYWVRDGIGLRRLRPDWVSIITGDPDKGQRATDLLGYTYTDGGPGSGNRPEVFMPAEVAHFAPIPDPTAQHRGMSWLTPAINDLSADSKFTKHRLAVAKDGAVHSFAVQYPPLNADQFKEAVSAFRSAYEGPSGSGKSIHIAGGADIVPLSMDLRALDFKSVQAGGETRLAAAARVPAVIAGISEGLAGSSLNQGNYGMARRQFGDLFARPAWRSVAGAFSTLVDAPNGSTVLWWDESDIGFLREDQKDAAEVVAKKAAAMRQLVDAGYDADTVVAAVETVDLTKLQHTRLFSVQLQPPGGGQAALPEGTP